MEVIREIPLIRWLRWVKRLIKWMVVGTLVGSFALLLLILYLRSQPLPPATINQTTTILASNGEVLDTLHHGENRIVVPLKQMAPSLIQATIAIEDRNFFDHYGFDLKRLAKAIYIDLKSMSKKQGASTISQQLARMLYLNTEKTWTRKIKEALLTIQLELNYSKDEILEMYLNQCYYGHSAYGPQAAAQTYFGKDAKDLTLAESALLAGIPNGPSYYSPYIDWERSKSRQKLILTAMQQQGFISAEQAEQAYREPLHLRPKEAQKGPDVAPYFRDYIASLVTNKYGISEEMFVHGGLKIYTTLDPTMQKKAEAAVAKYMPKDNLDLQTALIAIDPTTGEIKAMVGGRDYQKSQYNRVFAKRQPGSSFKPIVYLTALQNGFTPLTMMKSEPTVFTYEGGKEYIPRNFGEHYAHDYITLQHAIATSDNIYAVKTIQLLTPQKVVEQAHNLGITSEQKPVLSLALGTSPVSPYELTYAYAVIANQGERVKPIAITRIEDQQGNVLAEEKPEKTRVADAVSTFLLTYMMQSVFEEPGATAYRVSRQLNRPVAGKTGTTDYDAWLAGFTPQLATTVWLGYDQGRKVEDVKEARLAAQIWADFMESALSDQPPALFTMPAGITSVYIDPANGKLATESCPNPQLYYFAAGTEPKEYCTDHLPNKHAAPTPLKPPEDQSFWQQMGNWWRR
ncbi:PBP1A family penicillin-binding protein [Brevibacillus sp. SYP-B805]|uniref:transglycosylase domain-containing protein n=1 Tax=Brevibacillus sp. SYP-B805 TaxID=1578199 RepID=UPI0013EBDDAB|nr:PBP1A family penicillin-binding protein [Brevibacillus sp. SYP-B805]NGQ96213.1 PBP1A family penicillin-binding protein [Brevibacillus sp. SYP-B805]